MKFLFKLLVAIVLYNIFCVDIAQAQPFSIKTSSTTMKQGSSIIVTITRNSSASENSWVWIECIILKKDVGDKPDIPDELHINAPKYVFFDDNGVASFTISAKNSYYDEKLDQRELKIRGHRYNESTELIINKQNSKVVDKSLKGNDKLINSQDAGILLFPAKPKIEIKDGAVFVSQKTTKSISSESIKGFWIQCKLKGYSRTSPSSKEQYFSPKKVYSQDGDQPDRLIYLWIPLVRNNPFRYLATAEYKIGEKRVLGYNSSQSIDRMVESGHALTVSKSNSVTQGTHVSNSISAEIENTIQSKLEASIGFSGIGSAGASVSGSGRFATSKVFGFSAERSEGSAFTANYSSSKKTITRHTLTLKGPETFGFEKNYVAYHPIVTYSVFNLSNENLDVIELDAIGQYIDYTQKCSLYTGEKMDIRCRKSIKNYVNYILETSQFMSESGGRDMKETEWKDRVPTGVFLNYLKEFPNVKTLNPDILDIGSTINSVNNLVNDIQIYSDVIGLFGCEVNYSNDINLNDSCLEIESPVDCSPIAAAPSHQFIDKEGKVVSKFTWNAPVSATEFKLEIKKKDDSWDIPNKVITRSVKRLMGTTNTPIEPYFDDTETRYESTIYVARVTSKCGASGKWLEYSPEVTFSYDKSKCKVDAITATKQPDNTYKVTWGDVPDKLGYYVEYAKSGESFEETKSGLSRPGHLNPFNELKLDPNYTYRGGSSFSIRVATKCKSGVGPIVEQSFSFEDSNAEGQDSEVQLVCPALLDAPIVNFRKHLNTEPVFKWTAPVGATCFKLEIKSKENSWGDNDITHLIDVEFDTQTRRPKAINFQDEQTDYQEGSQYVARVASNCFNISDDWTEYSPEKEFKIPFKSTRIKTSGSLSSIGTSFAKKAPRNRRSNESKPSALAELEPALHIAPNPVAEMLTFSITNLKKPANEIEIRLHGVLSGQLLHSEKRINIGAGEAQVINKNLSFGSYILVVILDGQKKLIQQFIKQ